jgi:hypothetical protein
MDARTVAVSTRNVTLRDPGAMVTLAGTLAIVGSSLLSTTSAPPSGAAAASVTVACGCPCPWIAAGVTENEPPAPGAGAGEGEGEGEGAGAGEGVGDRVSDGDVETLPHWATANVNTPSARTANSR